MNHLYFGDALDVLKQHVKAETVDLCYLDPPFNSQAGYNLLYETPGNLRETAQQTIFRDMWSWGDEAEYSFREVLSHGGQIAGIMNALTTALQRSDMMAYLVMMGARLIEIHRALKPTGSLYLHCDPTASHYLKIILDGIFGPENFRNEIIWKRTTAHNDARRRLGDIHDCVLYFAKSDKSAFHRQFGEYDPAYLEDKYRHLNAAGRRYRLSDLRSPSPRPNLTYDYKGYKPHPNGWAVSREKMEEFEKLGLLEFPKKPEGRIQLRRYLDEREGMPISSLWDDIRPVNSMAKERLGYPTQKPLALLERIIRMSSNEGEVVLDPFCGCGTTVEAAQKLKRQWIGIDISYYAVRLIQRRLRVNFGAAFAVPISGIPADIASAEGLAEREPYGFQQWVVGELGCQLWNDGKKGADTGIDGEMWFYNPPKNAGRLLVQVKGGKRSGAPMVREFKDVLNREKAEMGIFFSRSEPTPEMRKEAAALGEVKLGAKMFKRLQLCSIATWFAGQRPERPVPIELTVPKDRSGIAGRRARRPDPRQPQFTFVIEGGVAPEPKEGQVINPALLPDEALRAS